MIAAWLDKHSLCGKSLPACGLGNRCILQSHCQNPDDSVRFSNENSTSLYLSLADKIQVNAQIFKVAFFSPYCSPRQHLGILEVWLACMTLWQCMWRKIKSSHYQCSLKTLCCKELFSASPCTVTLSQRTGEELILMYSPLHGVHGSDLWSSSIFPLKTLSPLGSFASPPQTTQEYSWSSAFQHRGWGTRSSVHPHVFLPFAITSVPSLPALLQVTLNGSYSSHRSQALPPDLSQ